MRPHSIRFRLIGWYTLLALAAIGSFGAYVHGAVRHHMEAALAAILDNHADRIGERAVSRAEELGDAGVAREIRERFTPENDDRFVRVYRPDGSLLYVSGPPIDHYFDPAAIPPLPPLAPGRFAVLKGKPAPLLVVVRHYPEGSGPNGGYRIEMGCPMIFQQRALDALLRTMLFGLPLLVFVVAGGGYLLIGRSLHPVRRITASAREITRSHLGARLPVPPTDDELEDLSRTLNEMIGRLQEAAAHAARFSADASHELRTPLTIIRGELESLIDRSGLAREDREKLASIREEIEGLTKITEALLTISHLDSGEARIETQRFDLAQVAESTADLVSPLAEDKSIALETKIHGPVEIEADLLRIKRVIVNLLDNAIKYTPRKGTVVLSCRAEAGRALLEVADTGGGIPPEEMAQIFNRFYRAGKASRGPNGGTGLGLSIVRSICSAHGGTVSAENRPPPGGARFVVSLPLSPSPSRGKAKDCAPS